MNREIAMAAGRDAGNRNMKKAGRDKWSHEDWNAAAITANKLFDLMENDQPKGKPSPGR